MRFTPRALNKMAEILCLAGIAAGCSSPTPPGGGSASGGSGAPTAGVPGTGGSRSSAGTGGTGGTGGAVHSGGSGGSGGIGGSGGSAPVAGSGGNAGTGGGTTPDASGTPADATSGTTPDAKAAPDAGPSMGNWPATPMGTEGGGPQPSYEGEIPIHYGPEVGPKVEMNCPEDPTQGWTEYQDSFYIERPYNVPINARFSIIGGIYNFKVFPPDRPHSPIAMGRNPRTEATYGGTHDKANVSGAGGLYGRVGYFTTGQRMYSADMLIEPNAVGSAIMQIHTTSAGGGPIGLRINGGNMVNNGSLTVVQGSTVPGGLVGKWFNFKASFDTATRQVKIYINNCLKSTYTGDRGDGKYYFKNGVYFCKTSQNGCFSHYKNIHLYKK
jgi:hypothetical protein